MEMPTINQILHHYRGYITEAFPTTYEDEYGNQSMVVDEVLRGRMETRLITNLSFEVSNILSPFVGDAKPFTLPGWGGLLFLKHMTSMCFDRLTGNYYFKN